MRLPRGTIVKIGALSDPFQSLERTERLMLEIIKLLNKYGIRYLIVTKSNLITEKEYLDAMDKNLAHIQISVSCLNDESARKFEKAPSPSKRIEAVYALQEAGFDVALRLSPFAEELIDFTLLNSLNVNKCLVEFLRVNTHIARCFPEVDCRKYQLFNNNYWHLYMSDKLRLLDMIKLPNITLGDHIPFHHDYFVEHVNPNKLDCCNLYKNTGVRA